MATLELQGLGTVEVGDEILRLPPEQQAREVESIISQIVDSRVSGGFDAAG